eukprot:UN29795
MLWGTTPCAVCNGTGRLERQYRQKPIKITNPSPAAPALKITNEKHFSPKKDDEQRKSISRVQAEKMKSWISEERKSEEQQDEAQKDFKMKHNEEKAKKDERPVEK